MKTDIEFNGEIHAAKDSLERALDNITKLWDGGEVRMTVEQIGNKLADLKAISSLTREIASYVAKFDVISK